MKHNASIMCLIKIYILRCTVVTIRCLVSTTPDELYTEFLVFQTQQKIQFMLFHV